MNIPLHDTLSEKNLLLTWFLTLQTNLRWKHEKKKKFLTFHTADPPLLSRLFECVCVFFSVSVYFYLLTHVSSQSLTPGEVLTRARKLKYFFLHRKEDCSCEFHHKS